jgi:hypothetical protein
MLLHEFHIPVLPDVLVLALAGHTTFLLLALFMGLLWLFLGLFLLLRAAFRELFMWLLFMAFFLLMLLNLFDNLGVETVNHCFVLLEDLDDLFPHLVKFVDYF